LVTVFLVETAKAQSKTHGLVVDAKGKPIAQAKSRWEAKLSVQDILYANAILFKIDAMGKRFAKAFFYQ